MTKAELMRLATAAAHASERIIAMGMMNSVSDPEKRLQQAAEYKIAHSVFSKAQAEYEAAIHNLSGAELEMIMKEEA
jgi:hypothetical protein